MMDINEIKERVEKASKGPWLANKMCVNDPLGLFYGIVSYDEKKDYLRGGYPVTGKYPCLDEGDANFIAHAREDIPYLLAEVERLKGEVLTLIQNEYAEAHNKALDMQRKMRPYEIAKVKP